MKQLLLLSLVFAVLMCTSCGGGTPMTEDGTLEITEDLQVTSTASDESEYAIGESAVESIVVNTTESATEDEERSVTATGSAQEAEPAYNAGVPESEGEAPDAHLGDTDSAYSTSTSTLIYGDLNNDSVVDGTDAMLLNRFASGWAESDYAAAVTLMITGDINNDGNIDGTDAMLLNRFASGWAESDYAAAVNLGKEVSGGDAEEETFTVTFVDHDGTVLSSQTVVRGGAATAPDAPDRAGYIFSGWNYDFSSVTCDLTVTAQYTEIVNPTFIVDSVKAVPGERNVQVTVSVMNNPGIASIGMYVSFGDELTLNSVTYNTAIGGQAVPPAGTTSPAKLTWISPFADVEDDWIFATLDFNVSASASGILPVTITYNADDVYDLTETNVDFDIVNGSVTVEDPEPESGMYTVMFVDYDGTVISTQTVAEGDSATAPADPTRNGYIFSGWDASFDNITSDLTVTAQYTAINSPTFVVSSTDASAGQENVQVTISLMNNPGIASIGMYVTFDDALTLNSVTYNTAMGGQAVPPASLTSPTKLTWVSPFAEVGDDCTFVTFDFYVSSDASGALPITIEYKADDVYNINEDNISFGIINGSVTVNK